MSHRREIVFAFFFGLTVALVIYFASQTVLYWPFLNIQNKIDDANFLIRYRLGKAGDAVADSIIIVDVDDRTLDTLGSIKSKRWPRRHMAKAIGTISRDGARLIFLDIIFEGMSRDNASLEDSVRSAGNVIAGYYFRLDRASRGRRPLDPVANQLFSGDSFSVTDNGRTQFIRANEVVFPFIGLVRSVNALGFANYIPDPDGVLRHIPMYIYHRQGSGRASSSAALRMWLYLNDISYSTARISSRGIRFGDAFIPTDKHCFMRLNFRALGPVYPYISFLDILNGDFEPGTFDGKIVMIGSSSEKAGDIKRIPGYGQLPGVEIHATALSTLLNREFLTVLPANIILLISVIAGLVSGIVFTFAHPVRAGLPIAVLVPVAFYLIGVSSFICHGTLINISIPSFTVLFLYVVITIHRFIEHYEHKHVRKEERV